MCGIAGIVSLNQRLEKEKIQVMMNQLAHRGPDGEGYVLLSDDRIALGHRRLSILDLSVNGRQPMRFAEGRYHITFNGEIYNYLELKEELQKKGYQFTTQSDTEVLLAIYDQKKEKCLQDLDGMFAFAIWDQQENSLFCARDRFGEKPFYFHSGKEYFAFASEMKSLFALGISSARNKKKIFDYLLYRVVEDPYEKSSTFYEHVHQLEPAHYMKVKADGSIMKQQYWSLNIHEPITISEEDAIEKFRELFIQSVNKRLRSDVPVGSSLSGGLDSSSIVVAIDQLKSKEHVQKTFSARFKGFVRDEGKYMQLVIDKTRVEPHFVYPTVESVMSNLENLFYHQEEPIGSSSVAIQFEVMKLARKNGVIVLLDGQGADEALAGYKAFWPTYFNGLYRSNRKKYKEETTAYRNLHREEVFENNFEFKWRAMHNSSFKAVSSLSKKLKSPTSPYFLGIHPDLVTAFKKEKNPLLKPGSLKEHLHAYLTGRGLRELLRYADRNSMANSVEVRLPFLYHKLVEFSFSLPDDLLLRQGWSKYVLRKSMEGVLPDEITWRKDKIGFEPPEEEWLKTTHFQEFYQEAISYLKKEKIIVNTDPMLTWNYISLYAFDKPKQA